MKLDLNCDLGEGEPASRTAALLRRVTSANIACGGHAGDARSIATTVRLARERGVHIGAHPGLAGNFGRATRPVTPAELRALLLEQVPRIPGPLHHVKLHGALYHATEADPSLAAALVTTMQIYFPGVILFSRCGGPVAALARREGVPVWEEAFSDRSYLPDGTLVPRDKPGALVTTPAEIKKRLRQLLATGTLPAIDGSSVPLQPQTLCLHCDTPDALKLATAARESLTGG